MLTSTPVSKLTSRPGQLASGAAQARKATKVPRDFRVREATAAPGAAKGLVARQVRWGSRVSRELTAARAPTGPQETEALRALQGLVGGVGAKGGAATRVRLARTVRMALQVPWG